MTDEIILNRIQCNLCGDIITSHHRHDFVTCKCSAVSVDGGREYLRRLMTVGRSDYAELSIMSSASFEEIRKVLYRGSLGKNGDQPLTWVALSEISDNYLDNLITYQENHCGWATIDYKYQLTERQYRIDNNIVIEEK